jgi:uncharacterized membrane protein YdjX (TVP38/TMEM64 family)
MLRAMPGVAESLALYFVGMLGAMAVALPIEPATLLVAKVAAPWMVATTATAAAVLLAVVDYAFVRRAFRTRLLEAVRQKPLFTRAERWAKVAPFLTTAAFAGLPIPFLIVRVLVPVSGYPLARYVAAVALGRFARFYVVAAFGTAWARYLPTNLLVAVMVAIVVVAVASAALHRWRAGRRDAEAEAPLVAADPEP